MANKNHTLDNQIIKAAYNEFLENGFEKASMRKIASNANVTIGAIYTRYKTKDELFCALVNPLITNIFKAYSDIKNQYFNHETNNMESMINNIKQENLVILHLLFDDYTQAKLLLCRSQNSSLEHFFDHIIDKKIEETLKFFELNQLIHPNPNVLKILITSQFHMYFQIINDGYSLNEAKEIMNDVMIYHLNGWIALFNK